MQLTFICPHCQKSQRTPELTASGLQCVECGWSRSWGSDTQWSAPAPKECLRCGNSDLWRQKDFPRWLGLTFVALGAVASSIAWGYHRPVLAIGILMAMALLDMVFYLVMRDVLVCYRCATRHHAEDVSGHAAFNHELAERYRQEQIRLREAASVSKEAPYTSEAVTLPQR